MDSSLLKDACDVQKIRELINALPSGTTVVDFEENMLLESVRGRTRLWREKDHLAAFAFVDDYNNLWFEISPAFRATAFEDEIVKWGLDCVRQQKSATDPIPTLDASFSSENKWQIEMLVRNGFQQESVRSLHYERSLDDPISDHPIPPGFTLRRVDGEAEIPDLVSLHRLAFGTDNMTSEKRLAIMRAPGYEKDLDLVLVAPDGVLAAFCICGFEDTEKTIAYTDPIGTHPSYKGRGLGKVIVTAGMKTLGKRGAVMVRLGTSSENVAMQKLAESLGFRLVSEKLWFLKKVY